jgi:hypothetical protein
LPSRHIEENRLRHHLVDQPELEGLRRPLVLAGEDQVERRAGADQPGKPVAPARTGKDA